MEGEKASYFFKFALNLLKLQLALVLPGLRVEEMVRRVAVEEARPCLVQPAQPAQSCPLPPGCGHHPGDVTGEPGGHFLPRFQIVYRIILFVSKET